jgi:hypothetical protein
MNKSVLFFIWLYVTLTLNITFAQSDTLRFSDIQTGLESCLSKLSFNIDQLEHIQRKMDDSGRTNQNYDEQKNIFLSSQLALTTITAICEYNHDLLILFIDLREKNRKKYYALRIESLETSIKQIKNMYKQIQINYSILPPNFFEMPLVNQERKIILSSVELLEKSVALLKSIN